MGKYDLSCWGCNHPISEARDTVHWDESVIPRKPLCGECWKTKQEEDDEESD